MNILDRKTAPKFQQVNNIEFLEVKNTKLDNRIEVNYINGGSQEILKIDFIFKAGNRFQVKSLVASSTNQLMKEGTQKYSAYEISEGIDNYGAFFEVENSYDTASLTLFTLSKHLEKVLPFVKEVLLSPKFSENEFDIFKNNAIERFKINLEKVSFLARSTFMASIFGESHPYGKPVTVQDYKDLSIEDIRSFYAENYNLNNCNILVSGKVDTETVQILNTFFGHIPTTNSPQINADFKLPVKTENSRYIEKKDALQSAIRIGKLMPNKTHEDYFGLQILNTVLGGYFGSRLMKNIREDKGYTYGIGSGIMSLKEAGYFYISTEVGSDVTKEALSEIYKELEIIRSEKVSIEELDLVKNYLLGQLLNSCDGPFNMSSLFDSVNEYGLDYNFYNNYIKTIKEITPDTLLKLAIKYLAKADLKEVVAGKI